MDTEKYWEAMDLYSDFLVGRITERELYEDPEIAEMLRLIITPDIKRIGQFSDSMEH